MGLQVHITQNPFLGTFLEVFGKKYDISFSGSTFLVINEDSAIHDPCTVLLVNDHSIPSSTPKTKDTVYCHVRGSSRLVLFLNTNELT